MYNKILFRKIIINIIIPVLLMLFLLIFLIPIIFYYLLIVINKLTGYQFYAPFWGALFEILFVYLIFFGGFLWIPVILKIIKRKIKIKMLLFISLTLLLLPFSYELSYGKMSFEDKKRLFKSETIFSTVNLENKFNKIKKGDTIKEVNKLLGKPFEIFEKENIKIFEYSKPKREDKYCSYLFYAIAFDSYNRVIYKFKKFVPVQGEMMLYSPVFILQIERKKDINYCKVILNRDFIKSMSK